MPNNIGSQADPAVTDSTALATVTALLKGLLALLGDSAAASTTTAGTKNGSGDNTLVAAPGAGIRLVVTAFAIQNESATATTMIMKNGATACWRALGQNQGDGLKVVLPPNRPWKLTANTALILNLSGANSCGYTLHYYTETA